MGSSKASILLVISTLVVEKTILLFRKNVKLVIKSYARPEEAVIPAKNLTKRFPRLQRRKSLF